MSANKYIGVNSMFCTDLCIPANEYILDDNDVYKLYLQVYLNESVKNSRTDIDVHVFV